MARVNGQGGRDHRRGARLPLRAREAGVARDRDARAVVATKPDAARAVAGARELALGTYAVGAARVVDRVAAIAAGALRVGHAFFARRDSARLSIVRAHAAEALVAVVARCARAVDAVPASTTTRQHEQYEQPHAGIVLRYSSRRGLITRIARARCDRSPFVPTPNS